MPGDLNVYALGVEFKLNAGPAVEALKGIEAQAINIQNILSKGMEIKVDSRAIEQFNDVTKSSSHMAEVQKKLLGNFNKEFRALERGVKGASGSLQDFDKYASFCRDRIEGLKTQVIEMENAFGEYSDQAQEAREKLEDFNDKLDSTRETIENTEWKNFTEGAEGLTKSLFGSKMSQAFSGFLGASRGFLKATGTQMPQSVSKLSQLFVKNGNGISKASKTTNESIGDIGSELTKNNKTIIKEGGKTGESAVKMSQSFGKSGTTYRKASHATIKSFNDIGSSASSSSKTVANASGIASKSMSGLGTTAGKAGGAMAKMGAATGGAGAAMGTAGAAAGAVAGPLGVAYAAIKLSEAAWTLLLTPLEALLPKEAQVTQAFIDAAKTGNFVSASMVLLKHAYEEFMEVEDAFRTTTYRAVGSIHDAVDASQDLRSSLGLTGEEAIKFTKAVIESGMSTVATGRQYREISQTVAKFSVATGISEKTTADFTRTVVGLTKNTTSVTKSLNVIVSGMERLGLSSAEAGEILSDMTSKASKLVALFGDEAVEQYASSMMVLTEQFKKFGGSAENAKRIMEAVTDVWSKTSILTGALGKQFTNLQDRMAYVGTELVKRTANWDKMNAAQKSIIAKIYGVSEAEIDMMHKMAKAEGGVEGLNKKLKQQYAEMEKSKKINDSFKQSLTTIKQEFIRMLEPIMAIMVKALKPLSKVFSTIFMVLNPIIKATSFFMNILEKLGAVEMMIYAATAVVLDIVMALGLMFITSLAPIMLPLITIVATVVLLGVAFKALKFVAGIVLMPIIWAGKLIYEIFGRIWGAIKDVAGAIKKGFGDAWKATIKPLKDVLDELSKAWGELKKAIFGSASAGKSWGSVLTSITSATTWLVKVALLPLKAAIWIIMLPVKLLIGAMKALISVFKSPSLKVVGGVFGSIGDYIWKVTKAIFFCMTPIGKLIQGFKFFYDIVKITIKVALLPLLAIFKLISYGVKGFIGLLSSIGSAIISPFKVLIGVVKDFFNILVKIADVAAHPFKYIAQGAKAAVSGVLGVAEKIPLIGRAATWAKGKLSGSGLLGIDKLVRAALPYVAMVAPQFMKIGKSAMSQFPIIGGFFDRLLDPIADINKMVGGGAKKPTDISEVMTPLEQIKYAITGVPPERASPVSTTIDQEMGRESKGERELKELVEKFAKLSAPLAEIISILKNSDEAKKIVAILEEHLPKISERPSELGPAVSAW
jgi:hypothetical protein